MESTERGRIYWLIFNLRQRARDFVARHSFLMTMTVLASLPFVFVLRTLVHHFAVMTVNELYFIGLVFIYFVLLAKLFRHLQSIGKAVVALVSILSGLFLVSYSSDVKDYVRLYLAHRSLNIVELDELPTSDHERIQPESSVYSLAFEAMTGTEAPSHPDFVRIGNEYRWTLAVEPAYPLARLFGAITDVYDLPGTTASPGFQNENRVKVNFQVGEHLLLSHNSRYATVRSFGVLRFLRYEPAEVLFLPDDNGEWVQVISLVRYRGLFFPEPEFGGVQIIRQGDSNFAGAIRRSLFGMGEWIPPSEVPNHKFLSGQSLMSRSVSRFIAESFRFQDGFFAPFPFYHQGDVRVPDLPIDQIEQPFVGYFQIKGEPGRLYHYFALEPYDLDKQGLSTSVFVPADGTPKVFVYRHHSKKGTLTGVSAISAKIIESKKEYDWERNRPVEHRPFIKTIDGVTRFFWLTTVVTFKQGVREGDFIAGSVPDVVLTDATFNRPVWVDPLHPGTWVDQLRAELGETWLTSSLPSPGAPGGPGLDAPAGPSAGADAQAPPVETPSG